MNLSNLVEYFIHPSYKNNPMEYRKARLFVRACLLTSLFSTSYIWLSIFFEFQRGVNLMIFNAGGFLMLTFLLKSRIHIVLLGNLYVFVGAFAVIVLTYFSGGMWSAIYPWIISIPALALLVVNRISSVIWALIALGFMVWFGILAVNGVELPTEYNTEMRTLWFLSILPGLLMIIMVISLVFESVQTRTLYTLDEKNKQLLVQQNTITAQSGELEKLIEEKDHIIRILAHDLKNPLFNITGLINMLHHSEDPEEREKSLSLINQSAENAQNLVNRVLEMAMLEQSSIKLRLERLELGKVLTAAIQSQAETAGQKEIQIDVENMETEAFVMADELYLHQIFENLISNAVKYSNKNTSILVKLELQNEFVTVKVMDEGPGILPEEEDQLFQKFSKISTKPTANEPSSGLGLSLVKRYVEQIDGKVWYDGQAAKGSTFVVELPLA